VLLYKRFEVAQSVSHNVLSQLHHGQSLAVGVCPFRQTGHSQVQMFRRLFAGQQSIGLHRVRKRVFHTAYLRHRWIGEEGVVLGKLL
jgi:hypothetical protein